MSETKWTSGPWKAQRLGREIEIGAKTPRGHLSVAWVHMGDEPTKDEIADALADAALLASAPDLYAALAACLATFEPLLAEVELDPQDNPARIALARADAALRKARGEEP